MISHERNKNVQPQPEPGPRSGVPGEKILSLAGETFEGARERVDFNLVRLDQNEGKDEKPPQASDSLSARCTDFNFLRLDSTSLPQIIETVAASVTCVGHDIKDAYIDEFGALYSEKGLLDSMLSNAQEVALANEARSFMVDRYSSLGIKSVPDVVGPLSGHVEGGIMHGAAYANPYLRTIHIPQRTMRPDKSEEEWTSEIVHEITHAIGHLEYRVTNGEAKSAHTGWRVGDDNSFYFFEEAVATDNQMRYLYSRGNTKTELFKSNQFHVSSAEEAKRLRTVWESIYADKEYQPEVKIPLGMRFRSWLNNTFQTFVLTFIPKKFHDEIDFKMRFPLECTGIESEQGPRHVSRYASILRSLEKIARELYPEDKPEIARDLFLDDLARAQVTGEHQPVLDKIRERLGNNACEFFSKLNDPHSGLQIMLLSAYANANVFPREKCVRVREELTTFLLSQDKA